MCFRRDDDVDTRPAVGHRPVLNCRTFWQTSTFFYFPSGFSSLNYHPRPRPPNVRFDLPSNRNMRYAESWFYNFSELIQRGLASLDGR